MQSKAAPIKSTINCEPLKKLIREIPDFPKKGILFYDITTLLKDKVGFATLIDALSEYYLLKNIDLVLGIEARGFIFGPALAYFHKGIEQISVVLLSKTQSPSGIIQPQ